MTRKVIYNSTESITVPADTEVRIEVWGNPGGDHKYDGKGGYISGVFKFDKSTVLKAYGTTKFRGAPDVRISPYGLKDRIIVAGGGGETAKSNDNYSGYVFGTNRMKGGDGGYPNGGSYKDGYQNIVHGGTQTGTLEVKDYTIYSDYSKGYTYLNGGQGEFGYGAVREVKGLYNHSDGYSRGGDGWYGGNAGHFDLISGTFNSMEPTTCYPGGGGSSTIISEVNPSLARSKGITVRDFKYENGVVGVGQSVTSGKIVIEFLNTPPKLNDSTQNNKTLYEKNVLTLTGNAKDDDKGDVVTVKYRVNNGSVRTLSAGVGSTYYNKNLTFKEGYLYDGSTKISGRLSDGTKNVIQLWAEDDNGAKTSTKVISFYVVNNRPASININPIQKQTDLVETDYVTITGKINDPEKDNTTLYYKVNSKALVRVGEGGNRDFTVRIPVKDLRNGDNQVILRVEDSYGAVTERTVVLTREGNSIPLMEGYIEYKLLPPEGETDGLLLWIEREVGDLDIEVMGRFGKQPYKKIERNHTGVITPGVLEEDEFILKSDTKESEIFILIKMIRTSSSSTKGIRQISGVFN